MKSIIHVNQATIARNRKTGSDDPPLIVRTYKGSVPAHEIKVVGEVVFKHSAHEPLKCGARVWVETLGTVEILR